MSVTSTEFTSLDALHVTTEDDTAFVVRLLPQADPTAPVVLIIPAMVMRAKFYLPLARQLHSAGLSVATTDLRAQGESTPRLNRKSSFGYRELVEVDLPAITRAVRERCPEAPLYLFGHSLGGQVALLHTAAAPEGIAGICIIGTGSVYFRSFGPKWLEALWKIQTIGLTARVRGHWPGGMLVGGPMAGPLMVDWARHSRTGRYKPRGSTVKYDQLLRELKLPVLAMSLEEDRLGPRPSVDYLCTRIPSADVTRLHLDHSSGVAHLDHFEWIRDSALIGTTASDWITGTRS